MRQRDCTPPSHPAHGTKPGPAQGGQTAPTPAVFLPTAQAYDRWAPGYDGYDNPLVRGAACVVELLGRGLPPGVDVFECGCGTGRNLEALLRLGAGSATGCDLSPGMLAQAQRSHPSLRLFRHDMSRPLPIKAAVFQCVLFCLTLEHLADLRVPLGEAARVLRPGGDIHIVEIHPRLSSTGVAAHFKDSGEIVRMPTYAHGFAHYEQAFQTLGLRVVSRRDWLPEDFGQAATQKMLKRGAGFPLLLHYRLALP